MNSCVARVCLMGPSELACLAYQLLLEKYVPCRVIAQCTFDATTVWAALREKPDVVVLVCDYPTRQVLNAAHMVTRLQPQARILLVVDASNESRLSPWQNCAFDAIVSDQGGTDELCTGLEMVIAGKRYFSEPIRDVLFASGKRTKKSALSQRESELLPLLASGMTLREAAAKMAVAYKTADCYRTSLFRKLGVRDRVDLARYAIRENIIEP